MSEKLKACFCGGEVFVINSKITPGGTAWLSLQCRMCGAVIRTSMDYWQSRPIEDALAKKLYRISSILSEAYGDIEDELDEPLEKVFAILDEEPNNYGGMR